MRNLKEMQEAYNNSWYRDYEFEDLLKLGNIKKIEKFADKLINSWYKTAEKYLNKLSKVSCHWKREGFPDRYSYEEYLIDHFGYNRDTLDYLDSDLANIEGRIRYICGDIMNYDYELSL